MKAKTPEWAGLPGYIRLDIRRNLRDRRFLALVVAWPVGSYLLFSSVFGGSRANGSEGLSPKVEMMVALAAFGAISAVLLATGPRLASERSIGWLRHLSLTPMTSRALLAGRVITAMVLTLPSIALTFGTALAVYDIHLAVWQWMGIAAVICVGCLPFAAIGLVIGCIADGEGAAALTMGACVAFAALGGLWMPVKILPRALRTVAHFLPSNGVADLGWKIAGGSAPGLSAVLVIVGWLAIAILLASLLTHRLSVRS
jgi:ABC-2 type transport system permease protein